MPPELYFVWQLARLMQSRLGRLEVGLRASHMRCCVRDVG
jgi:hypothetical protein